ncbi:hypothetical protein HPB50_013832 [Hyalomma asiaticum]|uniref:Uncharacterized protein n=1 Tax=Hyalomma asiaticum TaxID=266040 RepID=A0ACB7TMF3_HYAAI|nr:hypothetical protein HPB50_013832 [Hyalomma asiaticum]
MFQEGCRHRLAGTVQRCLKAKSQWWLRQSQRPKQAKETQVFKRRCLNRCKQPNTKEQWKRAATLEHRAKGPTKSRQKEAKRPGERLMRGLLQIRLRSGATASDRVPTFTLKRTGHHHTPAVLAHLEVPVHLVFPRTSRCGLDAEAFEGIGRGMARSDEAVIAAQAGRGNRTFSVKDDDHQVYLPSLPTERILANTVFVHGDPRTRPFRKERVGHTWCAR